MQGLELINGRPENLKSRNIPYRLPKIYCFQPINKLLNMNFKFKFTPINGRKFILYPFYNSNRFVPDRPILPARLANQNTGLIRFISAARGASHKIKDVSIGLFLFLESDVCSPDWVVDLLIRDSVGGGGGGCFFP